MILAEVKSVDVAAKTVNIGDREIAYDYLILATGSRHSYFGHDEWEKLAPGLEEPRGRRGNPAPFAAGL